MPLNQIDPTALATWIIGGVTVLTMVILAALGSYYGSVRSVGKIEVVIEKNHGETMVAIGKLESQQDGLHDWVESIAAGKSPHIATINATLDEHGRTLEDHGKRLSHIEIEHAQRTGMRGCRESKQT